MENESQQLEALHDLRQMMKQSSRFLSLSGLSGVFAGIYALIGAWLVYRVIYGIQDHSSHTDYLDAILKCTFICAGVLLCSIVTALLFSQRKAKKAGQKLFDHTAWRLMLNMFIPLGAGGIFCLALISHGSTVVLVGPVMLIFYGMALVNGSKYTVRDIRYLGCLQIALGLTASFYLGHGLIFWALGFGVLHIIYGSYMWFKYDR